MKNQNDRYRRWLDKGLEIMTAKKKADSERLALLENWGGRVVEFLGIHDGAYEGDLLAQEGMALREEGFGLGLKELPSTFKRKCLFCQYWEPVDGNADDQLGTCECRESNFHDDERDRDDAACEQWGEA